MILLAWVVAYSYLIIFGHSSQIRLARFVPINLHVLSGLLEPINQASFSWDPNELHYLWWALAACNFIYDSNFDLIIWLPSCYATYIRPYLVSMILGIPGTSFNSVAWCYSFDAQCCFLYSLPVPALNHLCAHDAHSELNGKKPETKFDSNVRWKLFGACWWKSTWCRPQSTIKIWQSAWPLDD